MKICFLINPETPVAQAENVQYLAEAARSLGHKAVMASIDKLALHDGKVVSHLEPGERETDLESYDLVWVLSVGAREGFLDKIQFLNLLSKQTRVINSPDALLYMHSKISLSGLRSGIKYPETHISCDTEKLWQMFKQRGGKWVIKPVARSFGEGVALLAKRTQLETITDEGKEYCLMQRFIPQIEHGEKRVLVAGGKIVGQYLRQGKKDFRTNLHQGAEASECDLTREEKQACKRIAEYLLTQGVVFAGLDLVWPYILEWNVISPGGIATIDKLTGKNLARNVLQNILAYLGSSIKQETGKEILCAGAVKPRRS